MGKIATIQIGWNPNPSKGLVKRVGFLSIDGAEATTIEATGVESVVIEAKAESSVVFYTEVTDDEDNVVRSEQFQFNVPDGELPVADAGFTRTILSFRDEDPPVVPVADGEVAV